jgi:hypothetical protein
MGLPILERPPIRDLLRQTRITIDSNNKIVKNVDPQLRASYFLLIINFSYLFYSQYGNS